MDKWEYQILDYEVKGGIARKIHIEEDYAAKLNALGREGWELAGIIPFTENQGRLARVHLILKKPERF